MTDTGISSKANYVFLASNAYSGSTLLSYLMGAHPEIATVSDVSGTRRSAKMETFQCSCGRLMTACPFWEQVIEGMRARGYHDVRLADFELGFDSGTPRWFARQRARSLRFGIAEAVRDAALGVLPGSRSAMRRIGERNRAFAQSVLEVTGKRVFLDASKERLRGRYLERYLGAPLLVIHLVRDVRGVVESTLRRGKLGLTIEGAATRWARTNASILRALEGTPSERQLLVRYEDLCLQPENTLTRIFGFCGVDPVAATPATGELHMLGNRMRLDGPTGEIRLDERWREALTPAQQAAAITAAGSVYHVLYSTTPDGGPSAGRAGAVEHA